jgi:hypothetical protein
MLGIHRETVAKHIAAAVEVLAKPDPLVRSLGNAEETACNEPKEQR